MFVSARNVLNMMIILSKNLNAFRNLNGILTDKQIDCSLFITESLLSYT